MQAPGRKFAITHLSRQHNLGLIMAAKPKITYYNKPIIIGSFIYGFYISIIILAMALQADCTSPALVLNTAQISPRTTPAGTGFQDLIIKEAFRRLGISIKIVHLPSERSLVNANEGIDDGVFVRVAGMEADYPNLVIVPEPITNFEFVIFYKKVPTKLSGWDSLKPYNVGIIRGWKILEHNLADVKSLTIVKDETALFSMLDEGRVDLIVYDKLQGLSLIKGNKFDNIRLLEPPIVIKPMYLYLNKRHQEIVPKLLKVLQEMRVSGLTEAIITEANRILMP